MAKQYGSREVAVIVIAALALLAFAIIAGREPRVADTEALIRGEIEEARFCDTDADCAIAGSKCPFGCNIAVSSEHRERISSLLQSYESTCIYSCVPADSVRCVENKCTTIFAGP